ncbi:ficolin-3-like [Asterias rubens]|uniref:ficolin-3-like n=1 Tax=Asterias rubens TaxID=7604 RepID=UPI00145572E6|nr:ficolin-3-like [Asterias rubens]
MALFYDVALWVVFVLAVKQTTASPCYHQMRRREFFRAENKQLQQVPYQQTVSSSHVLCVSYCHADPQCHSVNYNIDNHLCELNNATRAQYPNEFITHYGSVYFDAGLHTPLSSARRYSGCNELKMAGYNVTGVYEIFPDALGKGIKVQCDMELEYSSCKTLLEAGYDVSGVYKIHPLGFKDGLQVYCDMDGGGWIVTQRRQDGSVNFYRNWTEYQIGFGNLSSEFWLGNDILRTLTESANTTWSLLIELVDWNDEIGWAEYGSIRISGINFTLSVGSYNANSTAGDALAYHDGMMFTTNDRDNDIKDVNNCAVICSGAWWYSDCYAANLNGGYYYGGKRSSLGMNWFQWREFNSLKKTSLKIRQSF